MNWIEAYMEPCCFIKQSRSGVQITQELIIPAFRIIQTCSNQTVRSSEPVKLFKIVSILWIRLQTIKWVHTIQYSFLTPNLR